ncbi:MAG TPA: glycoside hydrolase family 2 TIM barrel-domain containing protein [Candidatus Acidoferrum sp.]|nr:glycoside hydrolase family 2 TIM barrel-domain containing protein [Candidatus Acidoferrum sp.]
MFRRCFALMLVAGLLLTGRAAFSADGSSKIFLHKDWQIQSSCEAKASGAEISAPGFNAKGWHHSDIPSTVVGALVSDKTYLDPNYGTNMKWFPGMNYSSKSFFANQDMPKGSPFLCSWWFRTEFSLPAEGEHKTNWLDFLGINYRANVWLNGQKIADANDVAGTFATFEFNVSKFLRPDKANALAVEVSAPGKNDLGITWVDWNPTPPDKDMGIWKEVFLRSSGDVSLRNPFVSSKLEADYKNAALTISADLRNVSNHAVSGVLRAEVDGKQVSQQLSLSAGEAKTVSFAPEQYTQLRLENARLWWPYTMGEQNLYTAKLSFDISNETSDAASVTFGVREVTSELTDKGYRLFKVNGRKILIRGAAWAPDLLLRWSSKRLDADLNYVRDMGLNTVRLEGRIDREEFYEKTDRLGILVMPGWTCCDAWEKWSNWKDEQHKIAGESLRSQIRILRNHPSVFVWLYGSDGPPPANVEKMYLGILKELEWPNPSVSSASATSTTVTGASGVKMTGPYEYVPPVYWLADTKAGGAYGYNTETSPGPAIPPRESLERFIPKDHLWPIDDVWNFHSGGERFTTINVFTDGLNRRYGTATSLEDYLGKAQAVTYDGQRAMFEAYGRNKYTATGVIQWMLNNSWPSLIWHLYDYYLVPAGGYFGTKKAMEPIHVQYSYDDNSVAVVNSTYEAVQGMKVSARLYNLDAKEKGAREGTMNVAPDSSTKAFDLPKVDDLTKTYFLRLQLHDPAGKLLSDNFYWLSTKPDVLDWKHKKDTVYTPQAEFGDLSGLNTLPQVRLEVKSAKEEQGSKGVRVSVRNPSGSIAFMVHLRVTKGKGGEGLTPIFWSDNYFSLLPGEQKEVSAGYDPSDLDSKAPVIEVDGYNVVASTIAASGQ